MKAHGSGRTTEIAVGDGADYALMVYEAVVIGWRVHAIGPQPAPDDRAPDRVQHIEEAKQQGVSAGLRDLPVQLVIDVLVLPPCRRLAGLDE